MPSAVINVKDLSKTYIVDERESGLRAALRSYAKRRTREVRAVDEISFSLNAGLATLSFWFIRVENILEIFQSMYEAGRWPVSLYPGWLRFLLTFVIPVAFATTVPAEALVGRLTWQTLIETCALAVAMLVVSRIFWKTGLKHYSSASS